MPEITYSLTIEPEDIPVEGNALASGDDAQDRECEQEILRRLDSGDLWAWCTVCVTAEIEGFKGTAYLGGCSYEDEDAFKAPGGYWEDMKAEALEDLRGELTRSIHRGTHAEDLLLTLPASPV